MKVIMTQQEYTPSIGGGPISIEKSVNELSARGIEVSLYTTNVVDTIKGIKVKSGTETHYNLRITRKPVFKLGRYLTIDPTLFFSLIKEDCDLIHAHGFGYLSNEVASLVAKIRRKPFVLSTHGFFPSTVKVNRFLTQIYVGIAKRTILRSASVVLVDTRDEQAIYNSLCSPDKIRINPLSTISQENVGESHDSEKFRHKFNLMDRYLLCLGRITEAKGFQNVILAASEALQLTEFVNVKFVFVGPDGGYLTHLRNLARDLKLEDEVVFTGPVDETLKHSAISGAIALIVPSFYETFGLVVTEAMGQGLPVIVTKYGGAKELVENCKTGKVIDPRDPRDLVEALSWALSLTDEQRRVLSSKSMECISKQFTVEESAKRLIEIYSSIANK